MIIFHDIFNPDNVNAIKPWHCPLSRLIFVRTALSKSYYWIFFFKFDKWSTLKPPYEVLLFFSSFHDRCWIEFLHYSILITQIFNYSWQKKGRMHIVILWKSVIWPPAPPIIILFSKYQTKATLQGFCGVIRFQGSTKGGSRYLERH